MCIFAFSVDLVKGPFRIVGNARPAPSHNFKSTRQYISVYRSIRPAFFAVPLLFLVAGTTCAGSLAQGATSDAVVRSSKLADGRQRAFPTAEGFGAGALGGRGGAVIMVTNVQERLVGASPGHHPARVENIVIRDWGACAGPSAVPPASDGG